jgi:hypothetical protein
MQPPPPENITTRNERQGPSPWESGRPKRGVLSSLIRLLVLVIIALLLVMPFTPFAGKIKLGLKEIIAARGGQSRVVTREVEKRVEVPREVIKEVIKEVQVQPPLPEAFIPRKDADVATFFNGITIKSKLLTEQGTYASLERLSPDAYKAEFQLSVRVPKANQTVEELSRINAALPSLLPELKAMLPTAKVSGFYHKLYENKTSAIQRDITRLNKILDRHNFFDCETILELTHPTTSRRTLLIQSEMDVVCDGSDGDRQPSLDEYIYLSDYYQPFTSYAWSKKTKTPNPLLPRWEERLKKTKEQYATKGLSADKNRELKALTDLLTLEIQDMKARSSLIAEKDPFIVISLLFRGYSGTNKFTPQIGDYAVVIHGDKMYPAICGDYGPTQKMGEASLFMAKAINPQATPYRRPESDLKVTYLIFPGTAEKPNNPPNLDRWHEKCATYLKEIGAPGSGHELHRWADPFKKPEPPPVAVTGQAAVTPPPPGSTPAAGPGAALNVQPASPAGTASTTNTAPSSPAKSTQPATPASLAPDSVPSTPPVATPSPSTPATQGSTSR